MKDLVDDVFEHVKKKARRDVDRDVVMLAVQVSTLLNSHRFLLWQLFISDGYENQ